MKKNYKANLFGYTLIELVIVMALLLVVGAIIAGILASTLRGSNKTKINNNIAQNGNYALSVMSTIIVSAQSFSGIQNSSPTPTPYSTCANTPITGKSITVKSFDGGVTTFKCNDTAGTISSNSASLIDTTQVKVVPSSCSFTCTQTDVYSPPHILVSFQLQNAQASGVEGTGRVTFSTSLSIRNYGLQ